MALTSISPAMQQRLAVAVPIIALGISLFVVYPAWGRYQELRSEEGRQEEQLNTLKANPVPPPGPVQPTVDRSPSEPPQFLGLVTRLANDSGCRIAGFNVAPVESKTDQTARPIRATIELDCRYPQFRSFLYQAAHAERVLTVTDIKITAPAASNQPFATVGPLKATIGLERYVTTPVSN